MFQIPEIYILTLLFFMCYLPDDITLQLNGDSRVFSHLAVFKSISLMNCLDVHENRTRQASSGTLGLFDCGWQDVMMADM